MKQTEHVQSLFSYGTLQDETVQLSTFGRILTGTLDELSAYSQRTFGPYLNIQFTGNESDSVRGTRFEISMTELEEADIYETTADYKRIEVRLNSGIRAWVYLNQDGQ
jgi:gamma-glutamylcyclotransferase (GGCT)/AIG2-like uncharacterized protein YtfP